MKENQLNKPLDKQLEKISAQKEVAEISKTPEQIAKSSLEIGNELARSAESRGNERLETIKEYDGVTPKDINEAQTVVEGAKEQIIQARKKMEGEIKTEWDSNGNEPPPLPEESVSYKNISEMKEREHINPDERSVEQVIRRNNAFIVHKIEERGELRHNTNSNISEYTTYKDDIDVMLAFEPSISASSFTPGKKTNLWPGASGFLLGGGQIGEASTTDSGTHVEGIKKRGGENASIEKIDKTVGRQDKFSKEDYERFGSHNMNEIVVNNPEIFGFFQHVGMDEKGRFWAYNLKIRELAEKIPGVYGSGPDDYMNRVSLENNIKAYRERFAIASERGIPLYVVTDDRKVFECLKVNDNGIIEIGKELTPEEVATGRAGLPPEKRKEIGEKLLEKRIFKNQQTQEEAREIINNL